MLCTVSRAAYERGYGTVYEVAPVDRKLRGRMAVDVSPYLDRWRSTGRDSA